MFDVKEAALVVVVSRTGARLREPRSIRISSIDSSLMRTMTKMMMLVAFIVKVSHSLLVSVLLCAYNISWYKKYSCHTSTILIIRGRFSSLDLFSKQIITKRRLLRWLRVGSGTRLCSKY